MTTFYISRHGETENNKNKRLSGWIDSPLTELGEQNALATAAKLRDVRFDKIIASDLGRAFVTAYLIARELGYTAEIERQRGLREVNYGVLANQPFSAYPPGMTPTENGYFVPEGGESLAQMQTRVLACLRQLNADNPDKTLLLVVHDGTINAVKAAFTNENVGVVDAETENPHDFAAKFTFQDDLPTPYEVL